MKTKKISAVVITLNEEKNIERCLRSLAWADEVIVYDSGSTDQTCDLAQKMGAKVVQGKWLGFGPTKRKATELAQFDWVLSIDADEEVPYKLQQEILENIDRLNPEVGYRIPRLSFYLQTWIRHGGWFPDYQLRLFNKKYCQWNEAPIHEKVECGQVALLKNYFHHYVFKNIEHQVQTNNRYSTLQAQQMHDRGKTFSWFHFFTKPYVKFIECYFLKLGFLDGWAGYAIARNAAYSVLLKWMKLKEIQDIRSGQQLQNKAGEIDGVGKDIGASKNTVVGKGAEISKNTVVSKGAGAGLKTEKRKSAGLALQINSIGVFVILFSLFLSQARAIENQISPEIYVEKTWGNPQYFFERTKGMSNLKENTQLVQSGTIDTTSDQVLKFKVSKDLEIVVFPQSKIHLKIYQQDRYHVLSEILIERGKIYFRDEAQGKILSQIKIQSLFFSWQKPASEFLTEVDMNKSRLRVCAGEVKDQIEVLNDLKLPLYDLEDVKSLKAGEEIVFQGVSDGVGLAFDVLLKGKKIPQGEWQKIQSCDLKKEMQVVQDLEKRRREEIEKQKALKQAREKIKKSLAAKSLCHEPNGQFRQCVWVRESNRCVRKKCDAQGHWSEALVLPESSSSLCESKPIIRPCDY